MVPGRESGLTRSGEPDSEDDDDARTNGQVRRRDDRRDERTRGRNAPQRADRTTSRHRTCQGLLEPDARKRARPVLIGGPASQGAGPTRRWSPSFRRTAPGSGRAQTRPARGELRGPRTSAAGDLPRCCGRYLAARCGEPAVRKFRRACHAMRRPWGTRGTSAIAVRAVPVVRSGERAQGRRAPTPSLSWPASSRLNPGRQAPAGRAEGRESRPLAQLGRRLSPPSPRVPTVRSFRAPRAPRSAPSR